MNFFSNINPSLGDIGVHFYMFVYLLLDPVYCIQFHVNRLSTFCRFVKNLANSIGNTSKYNVNCNRNFRSEC